MIVPREGRNTTGQMPFLLNALKGPTAQPQPATAEGDRDSTRVPSQLNLAASHILLGLVSAVSFIGILFWAIVRLWLFE